MSRVRRPLLDRFVTTVGSLGAIAATAHTLANLRQLRTPSLHPPVVERRVSVMIPARNEASKIGACLSAVESQRGVNDLEILVLDDGSSDGTEQVIRHHLEDTRVRQVESAGEPPAGWLGKPWACQQLSDHAHGELLVFIDADVALTSLAVASAVEMMDGHAAISPYPRQVCETRIERLIQPLLQWSWLTFLPLVVAERSDRPSLCAANGQFLVITREAYDTIGGHAVVRGSVLEDLDLFRQLKAHGLRGLVADGTTLATCRMYEDWPQLRDGYAKSLWSAFGGTRGAATVVGALCLCYVVPPLAMLRGSRIGAIGYLAGVAGRATVARRVGGRSWPDSAAHPVSIVALSYLVMRSVRGRRRGTLVWKGRSIDGGQSTATT